MFIEIAVHVFDRRLSYHVIIFNMKLQGRVTATVTLACLLCLTTLILRGNFKRQFTPRTKDDIQDTRLPKGIYYIPRQTKYVEGYIDFVCPSVRPSVRPSPCLFLS